jgi:hypothetical protein
MTAILRRMPFFDRPSYVNVGGANVRVKADQIIVWLSLSLDDMLMPDPQAPRFPAILDTGNTHRFSATETQIRRWAGIDPRRLDRVGTARQAGRFFPLHSAQVWLYKNRPGERDAWIESPPWPLEMRKGIVIYPDSAPLAPRLPLLGLRALRENRLHLRIDGENGVVSLRSPDWVTWLAGLAR